MTQDATDDHGAEVNSVDRSPECCVLAMGGAASGGFEIRVFEFDKNAKTLSAATDSEAHGATVNSVNWSPDGKFLGIGGATGTGSVEIRVYEFDEVSKTFTERATATSNGGVGVTVNSVSWSPDGCFLATGQDSDGGISDEIQVLEFDKTAKTLTQVDIVAHGIADVNSVNWSPDGGCLAIGGVVISTISIRLFDALEFPTKNVIKGNQVYCVEGNECPAGIGISGSSIQNLIIGNTAYNNIRNYEFVTNVFDQRFWQIPNPLQNIALEGCEPICNPDNLACEVAEIKEKVCDMQSKIDIILANTP